MSGRFKDSSSSDTNNRTASPSRFRSGVPGSPSRRSDSSKAANNPPSVREILQDALEAGKKGNSV